LRPLLTQGSGTVAATLRIILRQWRVVAARAGKHLEPRWLQTLEAEIQESVPARGDRPARPAGAA
jgi:hypothetical protein